MPRSFQTLESDHLCIFVLECKYQCALCLTHPGPAHSLGGLRPQPDGAGGDRHDQRGGQVRRALLLHHDHVNA